MRWGKKYEYDKEIIKERYAILPMFINGEWRWLEKVRYKGHY